MSEQVSANRKLALLAKLAGHLYRKADCVVAVSQPLEDDLRRRDQRLQTTVIDNVFHEHEEVPGRNAPTNCENIEILAVGSLRENKNHLILVKALGDPRLSQFRLTVAGDGPTRPALEDHIDILKLKERVKLLGQVSPAIMSELYSRTHVVVHPSKGETFGYVYLEASAAFRPLVAVRNRVSQSLIPSYVPGVLSDDSAEALVEALLDVTSREWTVDTFSQARVKREERFGPAAVLAKWRSVLSSS